ncbi:class I adenylate-forming enzyme family protein [Aquisediminimonas profunda]|uniref:class I adenylate-forming enzyme family protein n=1 Tax=Aquisediminimonas profunda TaxID=1550733 RepID=UPI001C62BBAE|nr:AMP-binding protein [Aquisediminimonas profunda]
MISTLADVPRMAAHRFGERIAVECGREKLSFVEIDRLSDFIASDLDIKKSDRVILFGENSTSWITHFYGILKAGGIVVPVNALLTHEEVAVIAAHCGANTVIVSPAVRNKIGDGLPGLSLLSWDRTVEATSYVPQVILDTQPAAICYTSGTTGTPKGATLTHRNMLSNALLTATMHVKNERDVMLSALPCSHVYGNVVMQSTFLSGAKLNLFANFEPGAMLDAIEQQKVTIFEGVPTMYYYLLAENLEARDLSSLRLCTVGGQAMPVERMKMAQRRLGANLVELWGMTELAGVGMTHSAIAATIGEAPFGSIGTTLPSLEARLMSLTKQGDLAVEGEVGELQIRGPIVMQGYWNAKEATDAAIDADGWLATGDIATADSAGNYKIVDRKKDMILTAGYNIFPTELEAVIATHRAVSMVAVVGIPDQLKGEIPRAVIVPKDGYNIDVAELDAHCRAKLASYKIPREFVFVSELPKTSSGKVLRRALKET